MYATVLFASLLVATLAFPANKVPQECLQEIQAMYNRHLHMSRGTAHKPADIMKNVLKQIDMNKCTHTQFRFDLKRPMNSRPQSLRKRKNNYGMTQRPSKSNRIIKPIIVTSGGSQRQFYSTQTNKKHTYIVNKRKLNISKDNHSQRDFVNNSPNRQETRNYNNPSDENGQYGNFDKQRHQYDSREEVNGYSEENNREEEKKQDLKRNNASGRFQNRDNNDDDINKHEHHDTTTTEAPFKKIKESRDNNTKINTYNDSDKSRKIHSDDGRDSNEEKPIDSDTGHTENVNKNSTDKQNVHFNSNEDGYYDEPKKEHISTDKAKKQNYNYHETNAENIKNSNNESEENIKNDKHTLNVSRDKIRKDNINSDESKESNYSHETKQEENSRVDQGNKAKDTHEDVNKDEYLKSDNNKNKEVNPINRTRNISDFSTQKNVKTNSEEKQAYTDESKEQNDNHKQGKHINSEQQNKTNINKNISEQHATEKSKNNDGQNKQSYHSDETNEQNNEHNEPSRDENKHSDEVSQEKYNSDESNEKVDRYQTTKKYVDSSGQKQLNINSGEINKNLSQHEGSSEEFDSQKTLHSKEAKHDEINKAVITDNLNKSKKYEQTNNEFKKDSEDFNHKTRNEFANSRKSNTNTDSLVRGQQGNIKTDTDSTHDKLNSEESYSDKETITNLNRGNKGEDSFKPEAVNQEQNNHDLKNKEKQTTKDVIVDKAKQVVQNDKVEGDNNNTQEESTGNLSQRNLNKNDIKGLNKKDKTVKDSHEIEKDDEDLNKEDILDQKPINTLSNTQNVANNDPDSSKQSPDGEKVKKKDGNSENRKENRLLSAINSVWNSIRGWAIGLLRIFRIIIEKVKK